MAWLRACCFHGRSSGPGLSAARDTVFAGGKAFRSLSPSRLSLLIELSSVPALRASINGRTGTFYLHPELDYSMGDTMAAFFPAHAHATVEFDFPGSYLREGTKSIALQAVATADKGVPDAGLQSRNFLRIHQPAWR